LTAIVAVISLNACAKKVSTTQIKEEVKPEVQAESPNGSSKGSNKGNNYETIAELPVPQPETSQVHGGTVESGSSGVLANGAGKGINDIFFDFDKYQIRANDRDVLIANSQLLKKKKFRKLVIEGHTDERGTTDYNIALGERRAESAKKYLSVLGIDSSKVTVISYGKEKPFCTEHNEDCWQQNRRAHFVMVEQ
jgi:peptidoglycan-associated lipoprotein